MVPLSDALSIEQRELLDFHLKLVMEENKKTNLTRIVSWESAQILHIEDSLAGLPEVNECPDGAYLDMGTGAGYPGIPLAVVTGRRTVLADSVGKKTRALDTFIEKMELQERVETYNGRIEELVNEKAGFFSCITARALSSLSSLMELASPLLSDGGRLVCYKAREGHEELPHALDIQDKLGLRYVSSREVTLSDGETSRMFIVFEKVAEPKVPLPRRVGMAQKKPY